MDKILKDFNGLLRYQRKRYEMMYGSFIVFLFIALIVGMIAFIKVLKVQSDQVKHIKETVSSEMDLAYLTGRHNVEVEAVALGHGEFIENEIGSKTFYWGEELEEQARLLYELTSGVPVIVKED